MKHIFLGILFLSMLSCKKTETEPDPKPAPVTKRTLSCQFMQKSRKWTFSRVGYSAKKNDTLLTAVGQEITGENSGYYQTLEQIHTRGGITYPRVWENRDGKVKWEFTFDNLVELELPNPVESFKVYTKIRGGDTTYTETLLVSPFVTVRQYHKKAFRNQSYISFDISDEKGVENVDFYTFGQKNVSFYLKN